jgi:hypothetical protein
LSAHDLTAFFEQDVINKGDVKTKAKIIKPVIIFLFIFPLPPEFLGLHQTNDNEALRIYHLNLVYSSEANCYLRQKRYFLQEKTVELILNYIF